MQSPHKVGARGRATADVPQTIEPSLDGLDGILEAQRRVLRQGETIGRIWQSSLEDVLASGQDLSSRLAECRNPIDATAVYNDWLCTRYERLTQDAQQAWRAWADIVHSGTGDRSPEAEPGSSKNAERSPHQREAASRS